MKIMIVQKMFHPNSIGMVQSFKQRGHDVMMVVHTKRKQKEDYSELEPLRVPYYSFSKHVLSRFGPKAVHKFSIPRLGGLLSAFYSFKPDVVVLKKARLANLIASIVAWLFGAKRLLIEDVPPPKRISFVRRILKIIGIEPRLRISTTAYESGVLAKKWVNGALFLPYPIKLPQKVDKVPLGDRMIKILYVGSWTNIIKRPWWLLEALEEAKILENVQVTFVGSGNKYSPGAVKVQETASRLGCLNRITMLYNIPHERMNDIYSKHDLLVLPTKNESFGIVVLEAMANGIPVVCSDTVGAKSCIIEGENGFVFPTDSLSGLSRILRYCYDHPWQLAEMGKNAREIAEKNFSTLAWAQAVEELIGVQP